MPPSPDLPPVYEPIALDPEGEGEPVREASRLAENRAEEGTLVWRARPVPSTSRLGTPWHPAESGLSLALVLRPEEPLHRAAQIALVAVVALGVGVAQEVPAMTDMRYRWPNNLLLGEGRAAAVNLVTGQSRDWLVLGVHTNLAGEPAHLGAASLYGEGATKVAPEELLEAFGRHFLAWINRWADEGRAPIHRAWQQRSENPGAAIRLSLPDGVLEGHYTDIKEDGSLIVQGPNGQRTVPLAEAFDLPR